MRRSFMQIVVLTALVVAIILTVVGCGSGSGEPADAVNGYVKAHSSGDIDAVMVFYTEDSVGDRPHLFAPKTTGLKQIRIVQIQDMGNKASEDAYSISNVQVTGNTVTWDHLWTND